MPRKIVIFNDIDGILLDSDDCIAESVKETLHRLEQLQIPLVLTSGKTRLEIEFYRKKLEIFHPFISENGGGVFVPNGYFSFSFVYSKEFFDYKVIEIGLPYFRLRTLLKRIEARIGCELRGFGDMSLEEICEIFKVSEQDGKLCKMRDYEEPFKLTNLKLEKDVIDCARWAKAHVRKKRDIYYLSGNNDKGKAAKLLLRLYEKQYGELLVVGIGCFKEDISLLAEAHVPILLPYRDGSFVTSSTIKVRKGKKMGPEGFREAVLDIVNRFSL